MAAPIGNKNARKKSPKTAQIPGFRCLPAQKREVARVAKAHNMPVGDYLLACHEAKMQYGTPLRDPDVKRWKPPKLE